MFLFLQGRYVEDCFESCRHLRDDISDAPILCVSAPSDTDLFLWLGRLQIEQDHYARKCGENALGVSGGVHGRKANSIL